MPPLRIGTLRRWCAAALLALGTLLGGPWHAALLHSGSGADCGGHRGESARSPGDDAGPRADAHAADDYGCALCALTGLRRAPRTARIFGPRAGGVAPEPDAPERLAATRPAPRLARGPPSIA